VNFFRNPEPRAPLEAQSLMRSTDDEKQAQLESLRAFQRRHAVETGPALERLQRVALAGGNLFEELLRAVKVASLGQISEALFEVGGRYRRAM
jgi:methylmalonyl-CoA mutase